MRKRTPAPRAEVRETEEGPRVPRRSDGIAVAALILLHLGFFWRAAILRGFLIHSDICFFFEPAKSLLHDALRAGRLPLWSPFIFGGYPIAAEGQIAAFHPLSLLISWLLPSPGAVNWLVISHLVIGAVSMYLLARALGAPPFAAWLAGFTFSFSGYLFAHIHHVSLLCAASLLPLVIYFIERAWRGSALPNSALAALAWAAAALCGHPQTLFHISLVVLFWVAWRWVQAHRAQRPGQRARALTIGAVTLALGSALAAVQLLPTAQLAATAPHGEKGAWSYVTSFSLLPEHLFGLVAPNWQGTMAFGTYRGEPYYWEYVLYIGILPLALAVVGATRRRGWALAGMAVGALGMALATVNPLYDVLRLLPGFGDFRVPARYVLVFTFAVSLLAATGWQAVSSWRWAAHGRRLLVIGAVVVLAAGLDLLRFDRTLAPLADRSVFAAPNPVADALGADTTWWRAVIVQPFPIKAEWTPKGGWDGDPNGWALARALMPADVAQSYRIRVTTGYAAFESAAHTLFFDTAYGAAQTGDLRPLSLVGVKYLVLPPQVALRGLTPETLGPFALFRNPEAFPRVFAVSEVILASDTTDAHIRATSLARSNRLHAAAVVQGQMAAMGPAPNPRLEAAIAEPRPERIVVDATSDRDCLLVLNEQHDPGWRARVDGRPSQLVAVDVVLMGTPLPKGRHTVEFIYQPQSFVVGRAVSIGALFIALALMVAPGLLRRRTRAAAPAGEAAGR